MDLIQTHYPTTMKSTRCNMPKYMIELRNMTTYEVEVEADSEEHAYELSRDWGRDELEGDETNNQWDIEIWEVE